jgi:proteasome alpha subunit
VDALAHDGSEVRQLTPDQLEVAVLDRTRSQVRKFKRISEETLARILSESRPDTEATESTDSAESTDGDAKSEDAGTADETAGGSAQDDVPIAPPEDPDDNSPL